MRRVLPYVLLVVLAAGYGFARTRDDDGGGRPTAAGGGVARVVRAVDGDTIVVSRDGGRTEERVRYIGVDTPETVKPDTPVQCFGPQASAFNHHLVEGRRVRLVFGVERRDVYGRLLAYVYRASDGAFVNAALVRDGYARTLTIAPNDRYAPRFAALQAAARRAGRGLWGRC